MAATGGEEDLAGLKNPIRYDFIDNSSDEILEAVREMLVTLDTGPEETAAQLEYKQLLCQVVKALKDSLKSVDRLAYMRKWGSEEEFVADGRIAHRFAERYLYNP